MWLTIALAAFSLFFPLKKAYLAYRAGKDVQSRLSQLVSREAYYIDEEKVINASTDNKIYSVLKTEDGRFVLIEIIKGKVANTEFQGEVVVRLANGDLYSTTSTSFIPDLILRDGSRVIAQVVKGALTTIELADGSFIPLELMTAEIINGRVRGVFSARATDTGYQLAGEVKQNKISEGFVVANPTFVSARIRTFGFLVLYEERKLKTFEEEDVLAAQDEYGLDSELGLGGFKTVISADSKNLITYQGRIIQPDYDTGTYSIAGLDEEPEVSADLIAELVNLGLASADFSEILAKI